MFSLLLSVILICYSLSIADFVNLFIFMIPCPYKNMCTRGTIWFSTVQYCKAIAPKKAIIIFWLATAINKVKCWWDKCSINCMIHSHCVAGRSLWWAVPGLTVLMECVLFLDKHHQWNHHWTHTPPDSVKTKRKNHTGKQVLKNTNMNLSFLKKHTTLLSKYTLLWTFQFV